MLNTHISAARSVLQAQRLHTVLLSQALEAIKDGTFSAATRQVREARTKEERRQLKRDLLPIVLVSGVFSCRTASGLQQHSGLLQLDVDDVGEAEEVRDQLAQDPHVVAAWVSPSGTGTKALLRIPPDPRQHKRAFQSAQAYFREKHAVEIDPACSDVSRALYLSHDPELRSRDHAEELDLAAWAPAQETPRARRCFVPDSREAEILASALQLIPAQSYSTWVMVGFALKSSKLSDAESFELWDAWSSSAANYCGADEANHKWRTFPEGKVSPGYIVRSAQSRGWTPPEDPARIEAQRRADAIAERLLAKAAAKGAA